MSCRNVIPHYMRSDTASLLVWHIHDMLQIIKQAHQLKAWNALTGWSRSPKAAWDEVRVDGRTWATDIIRAKSWCESFYTDCELLASVSIQEYPACRSVLCQWNQSVLCPSIPSAVTCCQTCALSDSSGVAVLMQGMMWFIKTPTDYRDIERSCRASRQQRNTLKWHRSVNVSSAAPCELGAALSSH